MTVTPAADIWTGLGDDEQLVRPGQLEHEGRAERRDHGLFSQPFRQERRRRPRVRRHRRLGADLCSGYTGTISLGTDLDRHRGLQRGSGHLQRQRLRDDRRRAHDPDGGTYLASTNTQTLTGGLTVSGGTFAGSTGTVATGNVTLSSGTLNAPSATLDVTGGNFTYTGGTFNADAGTVLYTGTNVSPTLSVGTGLIALLQLHGRPDRTPIPPG